MALTVSEMSQEIRVWMASRVTEDNLVIPSEDEVWERIVSLWPLLPTHTAEKVLCDAMRDVPYEPQQPTVPRSPGM